MKAKLLATLFIVSLSAHGFDEHDAVPAEVQQCVKGCRVASLITLGVGAAGIAGFSVLIAHFSGGGYYKDYVCAGTNVLSPAQCCQVNDTTVTNCVAQGSSIPPCNASSTAMCPTSNEGYVAPSYGIYTAEGIAGFASCTAMVVFSGFVFIISGATFCALRR